MATIKSFEYYAEGQSGASTLIGSHGTTTRIMRMEIEISEGEKGSALNLRIAGGDYSDSVDTGEVIALVSQNATAYIDVFGNNITSGYLAKATVVKETSSTFGNFTYDYSCSLSYSFTPGTYYVFFVPSTTSVGQAYAHKNFSSVELSGSLTYTITFDGNGVTVEPSAQVVAQGGSVMLPTPQNRPGYSFVGWNEDRSATFGITGAYTPTASITLYAIWSSGSHIYYNNDGAAVKCDVFYNDNGTAVKCVIYYNDNGTAVKI